MMATCTLETPAKGCGRIWSDAFDEHVLVRVFGQLKAEHVPNALRKGDLAAVLEDIKAANAAL
jgi:hypothetical protein